MATRSSAPAPPCAPRQSWRTTRHGITLEDPYAWLRADNWQDVMRDPGQLDPAIRNHLQAENDYLEAVMAPMADLRRRLFEEMKARIDPDDSTPPDPDGPFAYYRRYEAQAEHPIFCRRRVRDGEPSGPEEILLDGNEAAESHSYFKVVSAAHSPDHRLFAYAVDTSGSEFAEIRLVDLETGQDRTTGITETNGEFEWANDDETLFYVGLDAQHRPCRVRRLNVVRESGEALVYEEPDAGFFVGLGKTESRRFLIVSSAGHTTSEARLVPADDPASPPRIVAPREADIEYDVSDHAGRLLIRTNDDAEDFRIALADLDRIPEGGSDRSDWTDLVPHRAGRLILGFQVFEDFFARLEREDGLPRIVVHRFANGVEHAIDFPEAAYALGLAGGLEYKTTRLRFAYSSPKQPSQIFDYDMATGDRTLRKEQRVPSGHDPADYRVERRSVTSHDGAEVPLTLLYHRNTPTDGSAPALLYGYGAYGLTYPAGFSITRLSLVDRGFVFALAHIRGGMDKGYHWYTDGKLENKLNTFKDFIACAEFLGEKGLADSSSIAIQGGSAGGLLVGAVLNMRPDLFHAAIADVPFVDVLNTMCDADLPLTPPEWPEWGNPIDDPAAFELIRSYAPYDNVRRQSYPHMLITAGLSDPRVTYWEPAKWVARLREMKTDDKLLLLKTHMGAGHGGASGRFKSLEDVALSYAFLLMVFGKAG